MYQAFCRFSGWFKGHVCGQENRAADGLGTRLWNTCYDLECSSPRGTALRVCCGFAPNAFGSQPHSRNLPNHSHKPEVQLLEGHLRLTVRALYTQCMIHSPDISMCSFSHRVFVSFSSSYPHRPHCQVSSGERMVGRMPERRKCTFIVTPILLLCCNKPSFSCSPRSVREENAHLLGVLLPYCLATFTHTHHFE